VREALVRCSRHGRPEARRNGTAQEWHRARDIEADRRANEAAMRSMMIRSSSWITVAFLLSACGDEQQTEPGAAAAPAEATAAAETAAPRPSGPATLRPNGPCMDNREVGAALGRPIKQPQPVAGGTFTICTYGGNVRAVDLSIKLQPDFKASYLDLMRKPATPDATPPIELPGLGDDGFATESGRFRTLRVVKGTTLIEVSSSDPIEKQKDLVRAILAKLE
jgi:hypothetical protein